ncbi:MAG: threonine synthase [Candidatus Micrarchaeota archaeon]|nr:threonine synthase [Candidatus Micrarchaeota archaeon]
MVCFECGKKYGVYDDVFRCECGGSLDIKYDYREIRKVILSQFRRAHPHHWKYWMFYPTLDPSGAVSLGEGGTPLIPFGENLFIKFEGTNPTGSFKDRGSSVEITRAVKTGSKKVVCATTGNMGASVSCYSARAGLKAVIFVPEDVPEQKLAQIKAYGARTVKVKGTYEDAAKRAENYWKKHGGTYLAGDYPFRGEGEKSVGFEIADQLNWDPPASLILPVGNGTLLYSVYKAFSELKECGLVRKIPKFFGIQAKGCNPVVRAFRTGEFRPVEKPKTIADAVRCGNPIDGKKALYAIKKTGGFAEDVTDREIIRAVKNLGRKGIYAEPGGAVAYAGFLKFRMEIPEPAVCVSTGTGLKHGVFA